MGIHTHFGVSVAIRLVLGATGKDRSADTSRSQPQPTDRDIPKLYAIGIVASDGGASCCFGNHSDVAMLRRFWEEVPLRARFSMLRCCADFDKRYPLPCAVK